MSRSWTIVLAAAALAVSACDRDAAAPFDEPGTSPDEPPRPNDPAIAFVSTRSGSPHIYVADADGSHVVVLVPGRSPAWSWDGRRIAFVRDELNGSTRIYVMNADGSDLRAVTEGHAPSWTPAGRIAYQTNLPWAPVEPSRGGIMVVNTDGTERTLVLAHDWAKSVSLPGFEVEPLLQFPTWSPDSRRIAFLVYGGYYGYKRMGLMNADGSSEPHLVHTVLDVWGRVAWSPDGARILYTTAGTPELMSIPSDGGVPKSHYQQLGRVPSAPDWSPDGREAVFADFALFPNITRSRIFVVSLDSGAPRQLIPDAVNPRLAQYDDTEPAWSRVKK